MVRISFSILEYSSVTWSIMFILNDNNYLFCAEIKWIRYKISKLLLTFLLKNDM